MNPDALSVIDCVIILAFRDPDLLDGCFVSFFFLSSLVFWHMWPRVLVTSESSGQVGCVC